MKLFCVLALIAAALPAGLNPQLKQVNTVYILAMTSGMDQYLANRLTTLGVFQVVADPQKADAIITDRLGEPFEAKLKDLYPPPPPPPPPPAPPKDKDAKDKDAKDKDAKDKDAKDKDAKDKDAKDKDAKDDKDSKTAKSDKPAKEEKNIVESSGPPRISSFNRGRGNVFIVDRKSRNVIWSTYEPPKDSTPGELSKTADRVVKRLRDDLSEKKQSGG